MDRTKRGPRKRRRCKGRYARVWLSGELVTWARQEKLKPAALASCIAHTTALQSGHLGITIISDRPDSEDLYDL